MERYLQTINNENSRAAALSLLKKLTEFMDDDFEKVIEMDDALVDLFIKKECAEKSETTISNTIARLKSIFKFYNNFDAVKHLNLSYVKGLTEYRSMKYLTPAEVYNIIERLPNYQDKVLLLFVYLDLYDNNFETIRHLKKSQFKKNKMVLDDGRVIKLNKTCANIVKKAIKEEVMEKYVQQEGRASTPYKLNDTEYIIRSKSRKGGVDILPAVTLKKRFEAIFKTIGVDNIPPIVVKNSKLIYDLAKLEYESNCGLDINQVELNNYCKDNNMKGTIGLLNMSKKQMKEKIISEIVSGQVFFED